MDRDFVERRDDGFYLVGGRVPLAFVVREFRDGQSPEAIRSDFPTLSLEQVYGAITFYLGHEQEADEDIAARAGVEDVFSSTHPVPSDVKEKLDRARRQLDQERRLEALAAFVAAYEAEHGEIAPDEMRLAARRARQRAVTVRGRGSVKGTATQRPRRAG